MSTGPPDGQTGPDVAPSAGLSPLGRVRLDELIGELVTRVGDVMDTQDRLRSLLDAVVGLAGELALDSVLQRLVTVACTLVRAEYGALGVLGAGPDRRLRDFFTYGLDDEHRALIGDLPRGHGILGVIIDHPEPLRLRLLGEHALSYGFPEHHPPMTSFLGVPIRIRDKVFGNLYLTGKLRGDGFTEEDEQIVVALAAAAGVVVENARLYEDGARRQRWLEAAADGAAALLGPLTRDDALQRVAERAREVAEADLAVIMLRHDGGRLLVQVVAGAAPEGLIGSGVLTRYTDVGRVLDGGAPIVIDEALGQGRLAASGFPVRGAWPALGSLALLPMSSAGSVVGILALGWSTASDQLYRDTDLSLPASYAEQVTLALLMAQATVDRGKLAVLEDHNRIGRDLHDLVIQRLFAIGLSLQQTSRRDGLAPEAAERIAAAVDDIDATISDVRRSIVGLSAPATGVRVELGAAVVMAAAALGFTPRLRTEGPVDTLVSAELRPHLLAVMREALSNVARHAQATSVQVVVRAGDEVSLSVVDDGRGFVPGSRESGLANMRERAALCGGTFDITPGVPRGTTVIWRVPASP